MVNMMQSFKLIICFYLVFLSNSVFAAPTFNSSAFFLTAENFSENFSRILIHQYSNFRVAINLFTENQLTDWRPLIQLLKANTLPSASFIVEKPLGNRFLISFEPRSVSPDFLIAFFTLLRQLDQSVPTSSSGSEFGHELARLQYHLLEDQAKLTQIGKIQTTVQKGKRLRDTNTLATSSFDVRNLRRKLSLEEGHNSESSIRFSDLVPATEALEALTVTPYLTTQDLLVLREVSSQYRPGADWVILKRAGTAWRDGPKESALQTYVHNKMIWRVLGAFIDKHNASGSNSPWKSGIEPLNSNWTETAKKFEITSSHYLFVRGAADADAGVRAEDNTWLRAAIERYRQNAEAGCYLADTIYAICRFTGTGRRFPSAEDQIEGLLHANQAISKNPELLQKIEFQDRWLLYWRNNTHIGRLAAHLAYPHLIEPGPNPLRIVEAAERFRVGLTDARPTPNEDPEAESSVTTLIQARLEAEKEMLRGFSESELRNYASFKTAMESLRIYSDVPRFQLNFILGAAVDSLSTIGKLNNTISQPTRDDFEYLSQVIKSNLERTPHDLIGTLEQFSRLVADRIDFGFDVFKTFKFFATLTLLAANEDLSGRESLRSGQVGFAALEHQLIAYTVIPFIRRGAVPHFNNASADEYLRSTIVRLMAQPEFALRLLQNTGIFALTHEEDIALGNYILSVH